MEKTEGSAGSRGTNAASIRAEITKGKVLTFRDLVVWQKSMALVTEIYKVTESFPRREIYGLTSQVRRCSVSVPSNMAEGHGRGSRKEFIRFLKIAAGSLYELETQLQLCYDLQFLRQDQFDSLYSAAREIERMLSSLIRNLKHEK